MCAITQIDGSSSTSVSNATKACGVGPCSGACKRFAAPKLAKAEPQFPMAIPSKLAAEILRPYKQNATYLKSAEITHVNDKSAISPGTADHKLVSGKGRFSIPESCYIDDTGHFNAVEFNICYN
jgi:FcoT-like thioesterase domain